MRTPGAETATCGPCVENEAIVTSELVALTPMTPGVPAGYSGRFSVLKQRIVSEPQFPAAAMTMTLREVA